MSGSIGDAISGLGDWFSGLFGGSTTDVGTSYVDPALTTAGTDALGNAKDFSAGNYSDTWYGNGSPTGSSSAGTGGLGSVGGLGSLLGNTGLAGLTSAGLGGLGAYLAGNANNTAAQTTADAAVKAAQIQADSATQGAAIQAASQQAARQQFQQNAQTGIGAIQAGTGQAASLMQPLTTPNPIMLPSYRGLTDQQQIGLSDLRRNNAATLAASGLRGAGRAGVAASMDSEGRYIANARAGNDTTNLAARQDAQRRADTATTGLAGLYANQGTQIANTAVGQGNNIANSLTAQGNSTAAGMTSAGNATAGGVTSAAAPAAAATTANASLYGGALGALGSAIAGTNGTDNTNKYLANSGGP